MLREEIAQRFVDRLCLTLPYNVNIMDPEGVIIACRDSYRKGTYHDVAHRIVTDRKSEVVVAEGDPRPPGVLPGVNLALVHHDRIIGVVGVTGPPSEVRHVALSVKTAIEQMVDYEEFKEQLARRQDRKRLLITMLLYDNHVEREDIEALVRQLRYRPELLRVPVILIREQRLSEYDLRRVVQSNPLHTDQDMTLPCADGSTVVFRTVDPRTNRPIEGARRALAEYIQGLDQAFSRGGFEQSQSYAVGSIQADMLAYRRSFHHALWVASMPAAAHDRIRFFHDYIEQYLMRLLPEEETDAIFAPVIRLLGEEQLAAFRATFEALRACDMSIKEAAGRLGVHRNTVLYRVARFCEAVGLDPVHSTSDRRFIGLLYGCIHPRADR